MKIEIKEPQWYWQKGNRENQEDALYPTHYDEQHPFFVVCDGVGGNDCGEVASNLVCETFGEYLTGMFVKGGTLDIKTFENVLTLIWEKLYDNRKISQTMATTLAFAAITSDGVFVAHIGDSRVYQIRPSEGIIFQTEDHSLVNELLKNKLITLEEAENHPKRNVITRCMNVQKNCRGYDEAIINIIRNVEAGDIFLICSDGVYDEIDDKNIAGILSEGISLSEKREKLAKRTASSKDNNTAILIEISSAEKGGNENKGNTTIETKLSSNGMPSLINHIGLSAKKWFGKMFN